MEFEAIGEFRRRTYHSAMTSEHVSPEKQVSRVAIVTGGASGIGLAIAAPARIGRKRRRRVRPECRRRRRGGRIHRGVGRPSPFGLAVDVTDRVGIERGVAEVADRLGRPTILVNNAGLPWTERFLSIDVDDWERVLDVNLTGTFHCCQVGDPRDDRGGMGSCREHLLVERSQRPAVHGALRRRQVRGHRVDEIARAGVRPEGNHREHDPARLRRHPDVEGLGGQRAAGR